MKSIELDRFKVKQFVGFVVFIAILARVFCSTVYLFRNADYNRERIVGLENENPDMIYIGGSNAYFYWQPQKAWNDCGFTSYVYGNSGLKADNLKALLEESRRTQDPKLYIIGLRAFEYYSNDINELSLRGVSDNLNITSLARYKLLNSYFSYRDTWDVDVLSYYLDIAKYHTNLSNLGSEYAWSFINNNGTCQLKGYELTDRHTYLNRPSGFQSDSRGDIYGNGENVLVKLLEYCNKENLNVLFVVSPYDITQREYEMYNTIGDIVQEYGYNYLNLNDYYNDMNIDFATDFFDGNHVNPLGAQKYTQFLEKYILENYNMPNHKGDEGYSQWDEDYISFKEEESQYLETLETRIEGVEKGKDIADQMRSTDDLIEWCSLAEDDRFTMLITSDGSCASTRYISEQKILENWNLNEDDANQIRIVDKMGVSSQNDTFEGKLGDSLLWQYTPEYQIAVDNGESSIMIEGSEKSLNNHGINVVVFDNNYRLVVDSVSVGYGDDGRLILYR
jgi:hypothetical protein